MQIMDRWIFGAIFTKFPFQVCTGGKNMLIELLFPIDIIILNLNVPAEF